MSRIIWSKINLWGYCPARERKPKEMRTLGCRSTFSDLNLNTTIEVVDVSGGEVK